MDARDRAEVVVYYLPDAGATRPQPKRFTITTRSKGFDPSVLAIPVGSTVEFPNDDPIRHNVYSATPGAAFDLGFFGEGETREQRFDRAGLITVNCNVHHLMQATLLVLDTPHFTRLDAAGNYILKGLPPGRGKLVAWHPRATPVTAALSLPGSNAAIDRELVLIKPRVGR